jgi:hypothetical protein
MNKIQALNLYLSNYDHIYTDIINAIMNNESKSKKIYDKTKEKEMRKLKLYLSYLD